MAENLIARENAKLATSPKVVLFEIDLSTKGGGMLRITPMNVNKDVTPIKWNGKTFIPWPIKATGFAQKAHGTQPTATLQLATVTAEIRSMLYQYDNFYGCTVRRIQTYARFLDDGPNANPSMINPVDEMVVDQKTGEDKGSVTLKLRTDFDHQNMKLPRRLILRQCIHSYRIWDSVNKKWNYDFAQCPYSGDRYYDAQGNQVASPEKDDPSFQVETCCKKRFGENANLPFGGFPGVDRTR